jgi:hypothetical protein
VEKASHHSRGRNPRIYQSRRGEYRLTTNERKRILLNNIYGVDIDRQAVEVTKLSLLLKILEGETEQILQRDWLKERQRILPDLGANIKSGNSLISSDFYRNEQMLLLDEETKYRINVFDWHSEFSKITRAGGFDCVIGNPPYGVPLTPEEQDYLAEKFLPAAAFRDSYSFFMVAAASLTRNNGFFSFIVPNTFCDLEHGSVFRRWLLDTVSLNTIWQTGWAFTQAIVDTLVFVATATVPDATAKVTIELPNDEFDIKIKTFRQNDLHKIDFRSRPETKRILTRVLKVSKALSEIVTVAAGVKLYEKGKGAPPQTAEVIEGRIFTCKDSCPSGWRPLLRGGHINRYAISPTNEFVKYGKWLAAPRKPEMFFRPKLIMRRTDDRLLTAYDDDNAVCVNSCHILQFKNSKDKHKYQYILALLNSGLMQHIFEISHPQMIGKVFSEIKVIYVKNLPIRLIDFDNPSDVKMHDKIVELVDQILRYCKELADQKNPEGRKHTKVQIEAINRQVDHLVNRIYGLDAEDVKVMEPVGVGKSSALVHS